MIKDYEIIGKIGKGTFGIVYKVKRINDPLIYVIKQISLIGLNEEQKNQVHSEARILSLIQSNYVVKYYESFLQNEELNIVMEYCDNGDLCHYLSEQKQPLKEDLIWQIFIKITLGLTAIHKIKILHRDLKTLNIFLKKDMEIKIGDNIEMLVLYHDKKNRILFTTMKQSLIDNKDNILHINENIKKINEQQFIDGKYWQ